MVAMRTGVARSSGAEKDPRRSSAASGASWEDSVTQATKDALADAETLRRVARSVYRGFAYKHSDIAKAAILSDADFLAKGCPGIYIGGYWSEIAARYAFRAVPGLRG